MSHEKPIQNEETNESADIFLPPRRPDESNEQYRNRAEHEADSARREMRQQERLRWPKLNKDHIIRAKGVIEKLVELGVADEIIGTGVEGHVENYDIMNAANKERLTNKNAAAILEKL